MFDARSILDILVGGGAPQRRGEPADPAVFRDLLDQLGNQPAGAPRQPVPGPQEAPSGRWPEPGGPRDTTRQPGPAPMSGGSLEDLLREVLGGGQAGPASRPGPATGRQAAPGGRVGPAGVSLEDVLRDLLGGGPGGGPRPELSRLTGEGAPGQPGQGAALDTLRQLLGEATSGVREGAARIDEATGASGRAREAVGQTTGQTPEELVARIKELIANNQLAAGAALGGLGGLLLGTGAGRSLAASAIKLGGLAVIGGLAYKAYQNYQQGRPVLGGGRPSGPQALLAPPEGSGFEPAAVNDEAARRYIRTMIAAAAADGRIDPTEQQKIVGGLRQAGIAEAAQRFLAAEINNPARPEELAAGVSSPEEAVQVYTAARVAIDVDTGEEHAFLAALAKALGLDDGLAAQVDAAARGAA